MHSPTGVRAAALLSASAIALLAGPASADCTTPVGDAASPPSGAVITCDENLDTTGISGPDAANVTVNVLAPSGGISTTGDGAILLGDGATIDIAAASNRPVVTSGDRAPAIDVGGGATITVGGRVATAGGESPGIRTDEAAMIDVEGVVTTGGGASNAIDVGANSSVTIGPRANVNTQNSNSVAVRLRGNDASLTVEGEQTEQNGLQQGLVTTSSGNSNPVLVEGDRGSVDVGGEVRSSSGDATAILVTGDDAEITVRDTGAVSATSSNSNAIEIAGTGGTVTVDEGGEVGISSGNSAAIVSGVRGEVNVAGTISASSSQSQGVVLDDGATLNVRNLGVIETSSSESQAVLVAEDAATATVNVRSGGNIDAVGAQAVVDRGDTDTTVLVEQGATVFGGSSDPVLDMGAGMDVITVNGTVRGTSANPVVDLGAGNDEITINSSQTIEGPGVLVAGGSGSDTVNLNSGEEFDSSEFTGIEETNVGRNQTPGDPNEGGETSLNVSDDQSGGTVNAMEGGRVNVAGGGMAGNVSAMNGGSVTVESGGAAGVNRDSGQGGTIDFAPGSTAMVAGEATPGTQTQQVQGADFQEGTQVVVGNSAVLSGTASGDTVTLDLAQDAFEAFGTTDNARSVGAAIDAGVAGGNAAATPLITTSAEELSETIASAGGEDRAQAAAVGVVSALDFTDVIAGGEAPRFSLPSGTTLSSRGLSLEGARMWSTLYGGQLDVDAGIGSAFEADYGGLALGLERGFDFGTVGVAIGAGRADLSNGADADTVSIGLYGERITGPMRLAGSLAYTRLDFDLEDGADGDGDVLSGRVEGAYDLIGTYGDDRMAAPYAAISFATGEFDGGATTAGTLSGGEIDQGIVEIGVRLGRTFAQGGTTGRVTADLSYRRAFGDDGVVFAGTAFGSSITTIGDTGDRNRFGLGLAAEFDVAPDATLAVSYQGVFGGGTDNRIGVTYAMRF